MNKRKMEDAPCLFHFIDDAGEESLRMAIMGCPLRDCLTCGFNPEEKDRRLNRGEWRHTSDGRMTLCFRIRRRQ